MFGSRGNVTKSYEERRIWFFLFIEKELEKKIGLRVAAFDEEVLTEVTNSFKDFRFCWGGLLDFLGFWWNIREMMKGLIFPFPQFSFSLKAKWRVRVCFVLVGNRCVTFIYFIFLCKMFRISFVLLVCLMILMLYLLFFCLCLNKIWLVVYCFCKMVINS